MLEVKMTTYRKVATSKVKMKQRSTNLKALLKITVVNLAAALEQDKLFEVWVVPALLFLLVKEGLNKIKGRQTAWYPPHLNCLCPGEMMGLQRL